MAAAYHGEMNLKFLIGVSLTWNKQKDLTSKIYKKEEKRKDIGVK